MSNNYSLIDHFFSTESVLFKKYKQYSLVKFSVTEFQKITSGKKATTKKQVVRLGGKCQHCVRRCEYIVYGETRDNNREGISLFSEDFIQLTIDHIIPKCKGGANDITNKQVLCEKCNCKKGGKY